MVVSDRRSQIRVKTDVGEGFYDPIGVGKPGSFVADVGENETIAEMPRGGWQGHVIEGHEAYVGKRVVLTARLSGSKLEERFPKWPRNGLGVVAYIYDPAAGVKGDQIFSGICTAKRIENTNE